MLRASRLFGADQQRVRGFPDYRDVVARNKMLQSMCRIWSCWGKSVGERFFIRLTMKRYALSRNRLWSFTITRSCTGQWGVCHRPLTNGRWRRNLRIGCPQLLGHHIHQYGAQFRSACDCLTLKRPSSLCMRAARSERSLAATAQSSEFDWFF